jgi:alpha-beta hydrolase superfamily lysophospholipase
MNTPRTSFDGLPLHTVVWHPNGPARAAILISHGLADHSGRYAHVAAYFNAHGYAVYGIDHRGHGKSGGDRAYCKTFDDLVRDLADYATDIHAQHPNLWLYAHSMGVTVGGLLLLQKPQLFRGAILQGTALDLERSQPSFVVNVLGALAGVVPQVRLLPIDGSTVSRDAKVVADYNADPLNDRQNAKVGMVYQMVLANRRLRAGLPTLRLPLRVQHGSADRLTLPSGSQALYDGAGASDKLLKFYEGLYHELHNEPEQTQVFDDIRAWIEARS